MPCRSPCIRCRCLRVSSPHRGSQKRRRPLCFAPIGRKMAIDRIPSRPRDPRRASPRRRRAGSLRRAPLYDFVLLTEQTRDWERGLERGVIAGVRRYMAAAGVLMIVAVPVFMLAMPWLVPTVFGDDYVGAVTAARIVLVAAAVQLVLGWTKSLPVTIGRPQLRIVTHGIETAVLLLVIVFGALWGVTGAAVAMLISTAAFAAAWAVALARLAAGVEERHAAGSRSATSA